MLKVRIHVVHVSVTFKLHRGSGYIVILFYHSSSRTIRMIVLISFCSQGDNIQDAVLLIEHIDQWISVTQHLVGT